VNDPASSTDPYFLEIFDKEGDLIKSIEAFQPAGAGGGAPVTVNQDFNNLTPNGQFRFVQSTSIVNPGTSIEVAYGGWFFEKTNTTATDEIKFNTIAPGSSDPTNTPVREFEYEVTIAGSAESEKHLEIRLKNVRSLEGESIQVGFEALFVSGLNEIEVRSFQFFGTGGAPSASVETAIATAVLGLTYAGFNFSFVVPSIGGKILGDNDDDYLSFRFALPRNQTGAWKIDNVQVTLGSNILPYQYQSTNEAVGDILPAIEPGFINKALVLDNVGVLSWGPAVPIGSIIMWPLDAVPGSWLELDGSSLSTTAFPELFALLGFFYGGSASNFNIPDYRGFFVRGVDNGAGRDPDEGSRTPASGGAAENAGSTQTDEFKSHFHTTDLTAFTGDIQAGGTNLINASSGGLLKDTLLKGGAETRALNIYTKFIIKAL